MVIFTKKKRQVTFTDSLKVINVMLHSFFFLFLYNLLSLLNKLTRFHLIFTDDYEKKIQPFDITTICVFVAYSMHPKFLFRLSVFNLSFGQTKMASYFCMLVNKTKKKKKKKKTKKKKQQQKKKTNTHTQKKHTHMEICIGLIL